MRVLFLLPFVRNNVPFVCLYKEQTFETALAATLLASADTLELPSLLQPDSKIVEPSNFSVSGRNYVLAEETLEIILAPLHACDAEISDVGEAIAAYKGDGWDFYVRSSQEGDMRAWVPRFVAAVPGAAGLNPDVISKLGELCLERLREFADETGGKKKKKKKGKG